MSDLAQHIGEIATHFWGPHNKALSSRTEWRWGHKGSRSVKLGTGQWYDHEAGVGGGVVDLIRHEVPNERPADWLRRHGIGDDPGSATRPAPRPAVERAAAQDDRSRIEWAARAWRESVSARGTLVEGYLRNRSIILFEADCDAIRFHPSAAFRLAMGALAYLPAMICLMTHAVTAEPRAVHRTALRTDGSGKADIEGLGNAKKMLGPSKGCVIRLSPDETVIDGLGICEGIEDGLSVINAGWRPIWACGSAGAIENFPLLAGIEHLSIFADRDEAGQKAATACARCWCAAGRAVDVYTPPEGSTDFNDLVKGLVDGR
jgi:hypothetical protein